PDSLESSIYDVLTYSDDAGRHAMETALLEVAPNLRVLAAETDLAGAEMELATAPNRHGRLKHALGALADGPDAPEVVLIDCPPSLGLLTLNALAAADEVVIPMQAHFLALQGVGKLLDTVRLMTAEINPSLRVSGVVLCMHDPQATLSREVVADLEAFLESSREEPVPWRDAVVFQPPIRRNVKLAEAPSFGQSVLAYAPTAHGAEDYRALADAFMRGQRNLPAGRPEIVVQPTEQADLSVG
ncbi:MAG: ParA family protein, partial [Planctomycetota bacterium]